MSHYKTDRHTQKLERWLKGSKSARHQLAAWLKTNGFAGTPTDLLYSGAHTEIRQAAARAFEVDLKSRSLKR